jgi:two-component system, sensor histidine kinase YesM
MVQGHTFFFFLCVAVPVSICLAVFSIIFRDEMLKNAENQIYATVEQSASNINAEYENMAVMASALVHDTTLMSESITYSNAPAVQERYKASNEIDKILEKIFLTTNLKGSIYLIFNDSRNTVYVNRNFQTLSMNNREFGVIAEAVPGTVDKVRTVDKIYCEQNITKTRPVVIFVVKPPVDRGYVTGIKTIAVAFASSSLYDFLFTTMADESSKEGLKYIVDSAGEILISSDACRKKGNWNNEKKLLGKKYLIIEQNITLSDWKICSAIPVKSITGLVEFIFRTMIVILLLVISLFIIYNIHFFQTELRPLQKVITSMNRVAQGDFTVRLSPDKVKEFTALADSFNSMTLQLDELTKQIKSEQRERLRSEIKALRFQLNPHFVCNTLNTIRMMSLMSKNESITKMTTAFMAIMDDNLRDDNSFNSLDHELKNLENYIYLMQVRYGKVFDYYCNVADEMKNYSVPSMILQPIVENSIIHGIRGITHNGIITVSAKLIKISEVNSVNTDTGDVLQIEVSDNGCGMSADILEHIFEKEQNSQKGLNHIGIKAVYNRIKLLFGSLYTMRISSYPGEGTAVTIFIPAEIFSESDEDYRYDTYSNS